MIRCSIAIFAVVLLAACSTTPDDPSQTPDGGGSSALTAQIDRGVTVYAQSCARCHGAYGEGSTAAPILIGANALPTMPPPGRRMRTVPFHTAMELGMFIKGSMPPGGPATPPPDVAAVMAYIMDANGMTPPTAISPSTAGSMSLSR